MPATASKIEEDHAFADAVSRDHATVKTPRRRFRCSRRHNFDVSHEQWMMAAQLAASMRPPMKIGPLINWILDEGLKREWEAAIAAGAIVVEKPEP